MGVKFLTNKDKTKDCIFLNNESALNKVTYCSDKNWKERIITSNKKLGLLKRAVNTLQASVYMYDANLWFKIFEMLDKFKSRM